MAGSQANSGKWYEPETPYATIKGVPVPPRENESESTIYPFNNVTETESGHIVEFDDTPGSERINIFHRSGTFDEIHPNGDKVEKIVRDKYVSILRDSNVHIDGFSNITVDKGMKLYVNKDQLKNSEGCAVNLDIHVGCTSNINLFLEKGNCNVRLERGDVNLEMKKGDINFHQAKGNFNHFINGDYNLECTGHMHVVVGKDMVNEVGGSRDVRIDGQFDNLHVSNGYKETLVEKGDHRLQVGGGTYDLFEKNHETKVLLNRIIEIVGSKDEVIQGSDTLDVTGTQNQTFSSSRFISTRGSVDITTNGSTRETINGPLDITSGGPTSMTSSNMNLNTGTSLIASAGIIHFNGPPARTATSAVSSTPSDKRPIYIPGPPGSTWVPSTPTNPRSPLGILQSVVSGLNAQLSELLNVQTATTEISQSLNGLTENTAELTRTLEGPIESVGEAVRQNLSGSMNFAREATEQISNVADAAAGAITNTTGLANDALTGIESATTGTSGIFGGAGQAISGATEGVAGAASALGGGASGIGGAIDAANGAVGSGLGSLGGLGEAFTGIGSVIGDVIDAIVEVGCAIGEAITGVLDAILKPILDTINSAFGLINQVLGEINKFIGEIIGQIGSIIQSILGPLNDLLGQIIDSAGKFIGGIASAINGLLSSLFGGFGDIGCGDEIKKGNLPDIGLDAIPNQGGGG